MAPFALHLSDDLLFISRVAGTARALGLEIQSVRNSDALLTKAQDQTPSCVLIDLQNQGLDIAALAQHLKASPGPYLIAYGSHVDMASMNAARQAGCDVVLPRSKFVECLPTDLPRWLQIPDY